jgi:hypothetical protein
MNADIRFANSLTHLKIVVTALIASIVFSWNRHRRSSWDVLGPIPEHFISLRDYSDADRIRSPALIHLNRSKSRAS